MIGALLGLLILVTLTNGFLSTRFVNDTEVVVMESLQASQLRIISSSAISCTIDNEGTFVNDATEGILVCLQEKWVTVAKKENNNPLLLLNQSPSATTIDSHQTLAGESLTQLDQKIIRGVDYNTATGAVTITSNGEYVIWIRAAITANSIVSLTLLKNNVALSTPLATTHASSSAALTTGIITTPLVKGDVIHFATPVANAGDISDAAVCIAKLNNDFHEGSSGSVSTRDIGTYVAYSASGADQLGVQSEGNGFSKGEFTAPAAGIYLMTFQFETVASGARQLVSLLFNGVDGASVGDGNLNYEIQDHSVSSSTNVRKSFALPLAMNTGDKIAICALPGFPLFTGTTTVSKLFDVSNIGLGYTAHNYYATSSVLHYDFGWQYGGVSPMTTDVVFTVDKAGLYIFNIHSVGAGAYNLLVKQLGKTDVSYAAHKPDLASGADCSNTLILHLDVGAQVTLYQSVSVRYFISPVFYDS